MRSLFRASFAFALLASPALAEKPSPAYHSVTIDLPLAVTSGGTGSSNPSLIGGTNVTVTGTWPNQTISASGGGGTPGGSSGQIQFNNAGSFGGVTISGDGTLNTSTGALTISKIGGVALGTAAFQPASAFDAAGAAAAAQAASLPVSATTLPASFVASSLTSAAGGSFGTGAYAAAYVLPTATSSVLGGVKPDGTTLTNSAGAISVTYGTTAATAAQGNDSRITGALQSSALGSGVSTALGVAKNTTGGVVLLNGSPTSGNLLQWSATGAQDSGVSPASFPTLAAALNNYAGTQKVLTTVQYAGFTVNNGTNAVATIQGLGATNDNGSLSLNNGGIAGVSLRASGSGYINNGSTFTIGATSGSYLLDVTGDIRTTTGLRLNGSSSGIDFIQSGNSSTTSRSVTIPNTGSASDTLALLAANQTFSGAIGHSGSAAFSGAPVANAANTTTIMGGTTVPTNGANAGFLSVGGLFASAPTLSASQGAEYITAANGLVVSGYGTTYDTCLANRSGTCAVSVSPGTTTAVIGSVKTGAITNNISAHLWDSGTAPTTLGNGTLTYSNGSGAFVISATGGTQTITFVLPAATARWVCKATDETTLTTDVVATPTAGILTTGVTLTAVARSTGALTNFTASDVISGVCRAL